MPFAKQDFEFLESYETPKYQTFKITQVQKGGISAALKYFDKLDVLEGSKTMPKAKLRDIERIE